MHHKPRPVESVENLRGRIDRLFRAAPKRKDIAAQSGFEFAGSEPVGRQVGYPSRSICEFLDFMTDALPDGDVYIFGGVLRDMALFGRSGFSSDVDLVVEGGWEDCVSYIESRGAKKNKFGGYRLSVGGWPVDIWKAANTWAIQRELVPYRGIYSLLDTTVLNWDAILMNWRTGLFVHRENYFTDLRLRFLDVILVDNPNPLGMLVRVFRHMVLKDAAKISEKAARYLADGARAYSYEDVKRSELNSYGNSVIHLPLHRFFMHLKSYEELDILAGFSVAADVLRAELQFSDGSTAD